jgi:hypothetical protein
MGRKGMAGSGVRLIAFAVLAAIVFATAFGALGAPVGPAFG